MADLATLLGDAPPGEIDAVKQDILTITENNNSVVEALKKKAAETNLSQFRLVTVKGKPTIVSKYNQIDETTFYTHGASPVKFEIDHYTRETTSLGEYSESDSYKEVQSLQKELDTYLAEHYAAESVACVFGDEDEQQVIIIGRKLSPQNFFNGQLTALYTVKNDEVKGEIHADVHYFEEGNVRLKSSNSDVRSTLKGSVAKTIEAEETKFENGLNKTLLELNDQEFKEIRRQLPITRQPVDWMQAILGCNVGQDLEAK